MFNHWNQAVHSFRIILTSRHCPPTLPSIAGRSSPSLSSSTLLFLLVLPSFTALVNGGFPCANYPGGERHSPMPATDPDRVGVTVRLPFDDPVATKQSIRLATALFAKLYLEAIVTVTRSYANSGHAPSPPTAQSSPIKS